MQKIAHLIIVILLCYKTYGQHNAGTDSVYSVTVTHTKYYVPKKIIFRKGIVGTEKYTFNNVGELLTREYEAKTLKRKPSNSYKNITSYFYDPNGNRIRHLEINIDQNKTIDTLRCVNYFYDDRGHLIKIVDRRLDSIVFYKEYIYDNNGLKTFDISGPDKHKYHYNDSGILISMENVGHTRKYIEEYKYDKETQITSISNYDPDSSFYIYTQIFKHFDNYGRIISTLRKEEFTSRTEYFFYGSSGHITQTKSYRQRKSQSRQHPSGIVMYKYGKRKPTDTFIIDRINKTLLDGWSNNYW